MSHTENIKSSDTVLERGHTLSFADILDADTMECLRYNMESRYTPGNGFDSHYWAGGYRGGDGIYRWDSGLDFNDYSTFIFMLRLSI